MLRFKNYLSEEVRPAAGVKSDSIDIENLSVRGQINSTLASVTAQPAVTPYIVMHRISKALAYFHITLPKRAYLEGDRGVEVIEVKQFGHRMGMTNDGQFVHDVPSKYFLFISYRLSSSMGADYAAVGDILSSVGGMFKVTAKLVDEVELQRLLSMAEVSLAEDCDAAEQQQKYKAMAPKEKMHTALGDCDCSQGDSPSTKSAVDTSMRKKDKKLSASELDEEERPNAWGQYPKEAKQVRKQLRQEKKAKAFAKAQAKSVKEDKDPCWKGYEMIGMKKKGGRKVPNCVPANEEYALYRKGGSVGEKDDHPRHGKLISKHATPEEAKGEAKSKNKLLSTGERKYYRMKYHVKPMKEEQIDELSNSTLASYLYSASDSLRNLDKKEKTVKNMKKIDMRDHGMHTATNKIIRRDKKLRKALGEETLDEVSKRLLGRYIKKAHVSGLGAAAEGEQAYTNKDKEGLHRANKTGEKREQGIERAVNKMTGHARVHAKEETLGEGRMPASVIAHKQKLANMSDKEFSEKHGHKSEKDLRDMAARHGYGWNKETKTGSDHYVKRLSSLQKEETLDEKLTKAMSAGDIISDFVHSKDPKFKGKSKKMRQKMALGAYYGMHPEKKKSLEEMASRVKKTTAHRKMATGVNTQVRRSLQSEKGESKTMLVTRKGDPKAAAGGGVRRIPKDKFDPSIYNRASE